VLPSLPKRKKKATDFERTAKRTKQRKERGARRKAQRATPQGDKRQKKLAREGAQSD
jgi:hypothetical protein